MIKKDTVKLLISLQTNKKKKTREFRQHYIYSDSYFLYNPFGVFWLNNNSRINMLIILTFVMKCMGHTFWVSFGQDQWK